MSAAGAGSARLVVADCSKSFPGVNALTGVSLTVRAGEVHALLGENGAGKSTLGKIIGGVYPLDAGRISLDGIDITGIDERQAGHLGIAIVHQEGSLVPTLSVAENIFAGHAPTGFLGMVDRRRMEQRARELLERLGSNIDPRAAVRSLSSAQAQIVEIAKALSREVKLLVLDEPTAALTQAETARLFEVVRTLRSRGVAIIYISHRLVEIFELCDTVTVLKDGRVTGDRAVAQTSPDELIRLMVGREVLFARVETPPAGPVRLRVEHLAARPFVEDVSFTVRAGEIVCLAGLIGSGRSETCEVIFGARQPTGGTIELDGKAVTHTGPWDAIAAGVAMMPEDRKDAGLFLERSIVENVSAAVLEKVSPSGIVSERASDALAQRFIEALKIATPSSRQLVGNLSGGNQQKVLLAKWLAPDPRVLIVDEPTRGVDVGARAEIYRILRDLRDRGLAILVVSSDLPEVLTLADRILVMANGRTVGELEGATATEEAVVRLATRHATSELRGAA
jgi:ribose transport system ATP-binding protein/rhamnose transport system ATP-binding protein